VLLQIQVEQLVVVNNGVVEVLVSTGGTLPSPIHIKWQAYQPRQLTQNAIGIFNGLSYGNYTLNCNKILVYHLVLRNYNVYVDYSDNIFFNLFSKCNHLMVMMDQ
jgi:hypothetical protein